MVQIIQFYPAVKLEEHPPSLKETTPLLFPSLNPISKLNKSVPDQAKLQVDEYGMEIRTAEAFGKKSNKFGTTGSKSNTKICKGYTGILLALLASFLLSLTTLIAKLLSAYHPFNEAMWRFLGLFLPSIPLMLWSKLVRKQDIFQTISPLCQKNKLATFLVLSARALCGCTAVIFQFYALSYLDIGDVTVISCTTTVFVSILAYFILGEELGIAPITIALVTVVGIGVISRPQFLSGNQEFEPEKLIGIGLALCSTVFATFTYVALRWFLQPVHYSVATFFYGFYSVLECLTFAVVGGVLQFPQTRQDLGLAVALGVITFFGQSMFTLALKFEDAGPVALVRSSEVIFTFFLQILFLAQVPDTFSIIGASIIFSGVLLTTLRKWILEQPEEHHVRIKYWFLLK